MVVSVVVLSCATQQKCTYVATLQRNKKNLFNFQVTKPPCHLTTEVWLKKVVLPERLLRLAKIVLQVF